MARTQNEGIIFIIFSIFTAQFCIKIIIKMLAIASHSSGALSVNNLNNNEWKENNGISEEVAELRETLGVMQEWKAKMEARISQCENSTRSTQGTLMEFEERLKLLESKIKIQEFREKRMELLAQALERFLEENNNHGQAGSDKNIFFTTTPPKRSPAKISNLARLMASEKYRPILDFPTRIKTPLKNPPSSGIINNNYLDVPNKEEKQDVTTLASSVPSRIDSEISQEIVEKSPNSDDDFIGLVADKTIRLNAQTTYKPCSLSNSGISQIIPVPSGKADDNNCKENGRVDQNTLVGENPAATKSLNGTTSTEKPQILQKKSSRTMQCMECEKTFGSSTTLRLHAITHNFPDEISEQSNPNNNNNSKIVTHANTKPGKLRKIVAENENKIPKIAIKATATKSLKKKTTKGNKSGATTANGENKPQRKLEHNNNKKNKKKVLKGKIPITRRRKSTKKDDEEKISEKFSAHSNSPEINNSTSPRIKTLQQSQGNEATKTSEIIPCKKMKSSKIEPPPMDNRKDSIIPDEHRISPSQSEVANYMEFLEAEDKRTEKSQVLECLICQKTCKNYRRLGKHLKRKHEIVI